MTMRLDEAIRTAIAVEKKVLKVYEDAGKKASDSTGQTVFQQLAREEAGHVAYLESRLTEWQTNGHISLQELQTVLPAKAKIDEARKRMAKPLRGKPGATATELEYLRKALAAEKETSSFYRKMVSELAEDRQKLFARFLEIEEGHVAIVEAEIDAVSGFGFWFGIKEFDLEKG